MVYLTDCHRDRERNREDHASTMLVAPIDRAEDSASSTIHRWQSVAVSGSLKRSDSYRDNETRQQYARNAN